MTVRWLAEHRRVLAATTVLLLVAVAVLASVGGGSSAAQQTRRPSATATATALAPTRRQLAVEQAQVQQLRTLTLRQSLEISSLTAEVRALRRRRARHNHRK